MAIKYTKAKKKKNSIYVMFGFEKDNIDNVGYFGNDGNIVSDLAEAKRFPSKKKILQRGFAPPKKWLEFINNDDQLNHGFKFHLIAVTD